MDARMPAAVIAERIDWTHSVRHATTLLQVSSWIR
jgi:hypothetical protein